MADRFLILEPNQPPETGHSQVATASSIEKAIERATTRVLSGELGRQSVLVQLDGTNEVWSVQRHPEGTDYTVQEDEAGRPSVVANPVGNVEVRVIHDGTEEQVETDEEGTVTSRSLGGAYEQTDIEPEEPADA